MGEDNVVKDSDIIGWCFLDWSLELNKQAGAQGVLLYAMQSAIAIAKEVGKNREAECLFETYELYRKAARLKFYDENKGLFTSGADKQVSYASQVWMVLGNVIEPEMGLEVLHNVAAEKDAVEMVTPYIYHYYIEALLKCGAKDEALAVMKITGEEWQNLVQTHSGNYIIQRTLMSLLMEEQSSTVIAMHGAVHRHIFFADIIVKSKR